MTPRIILFFALFGVSQLLGCTSYTTGPDRPPVAAAGVDLTVEVFVSAPAADGTPCDDGDPCSSADECRNGVCASGDTDKDTDLLDNDCDGLTDGDDPGCATDWWNTDWTRRRQLVFDNSGQP